MDDPHRSLLLASHTGAFPSSSHATTANAGLIKPPRSLGELRPSKSESRLHQGSPSPSPSRPPFHPHVPLFSPPSRSYSKTADRASCSPLAPGYHSPQWPHRHLPHATVAAYRPLRPSPLPRDNIFSQASSSSPSAGTSRSLPCFDPALTDELDMLLKQTFLRGRPVPPGAKGGKENRAGLQQERLQHGRWEVALSRLKDQVEGADRHPHHRLNTGSTLSSPLVMRGGVEEGSRPLSNPLLPKVEKVPGNADAGREGSRVALPDIKGSPSASQGRSTHSAQRPHLSTVFNSSSPSHKPPGGRGPASDQLPGTLPMPLRPPPRSPRAGGWQACSESPFIRGSQVGGGGDGRMGEPEAAPSSLNRASSCSSADTDELIAGADRTISSPCTRARLAGGMHMPGRGSPVASHVGGRVAMGGGSQLTQLRIRFARERRLRAHASSASPPKWYMSHGSHAFFSGN